MSSFPRQEVGQNLEPHVLVVPVAIVALLIYPDLVIQPLDEARLTLLRDVLRAPTIAPIFFQFQAAVVFGGDVTRLLTLLQNIFTVTSQIWTPMQLRLPTGASI